MSNASVINQDTHFPKADRTDMFPISVVTRPTSLALTLPSFNASTWLPIVFVIHHLLLYAVEGTRDHRLIKHSRYFRRWEMSIGGSQAFPDSCPGTDQNYCQYFNVDTPPSLHSYVYMYIHKDTIIGYTQYTADLTMQCPSLSSDRLSGPIPYPLHLFGASFIIGLDC